ncbi:cell wall hydrolase [Bacillus sp. M6-12]|uniref:N-acetylmuramoyl-L-alanine amidase n=1 Tax=Bacillus sp. M6-12 TaxID=2054166 RepID=UPI000C791385|nr:N-acetylmuramoyl-L-alanine amidase [Bacillus sp. M6-12]PLS17818.1 cell wall hydrolase [Bacillus sp. M6-12]
MRVIKMLLCFVLIAGVLVQLGNTKVEAATSFYDVKLDHRAYDEIMYLAQGKIANGTLSGYYYPNKVVTRAEATAMIGRALQLNGTQRKTQFKDVGINHFASGYIQSAVARKIISGYVDNSFKPNNTVTRSEMAVMICKAFGYSFGNSQSGAAQALLSRGIAQYLADGTFGSNIKMNRADTAEFLARAINYKLRTKPEVNFDKEINIATDTLQVRTGPSTYYNSVGSLNRGEKASFAYSVGSWIYIKTSSVEGFVHSAYVTSDSTLPGTSPLSLKTIVIDPGHGGTDPGAIGYGLYEKNVVLDTSLRLKKLLVQTPFNIKLTRETDRKIELGDRVAFAKQNKADIFISVHANAAGGSADGTETFYYRTASTNPYTSDSLLLAQSIQKRLVAAWGTDDRGVKHGNFYVIRENSMPAILTELGFIDNKSDNAKLASPSYRQLAAEAIYQGILDYYKAKGYNVNSLYNIVD